MLVFSYLRDLISGKSKSKSKDKPTVNKNAWIITFNGEYGEDKIDVGIQPDHLCIDLPAFIDGFMTLEGAILIDHALETLKGEEYDVLKKSIKKVVESKADEAAAIQTMWETIQQVSSEQRLQADESYIKPSQVFNATQNQQHR